MWSTYMIYFRDLLLLPIAQLLSLRRLEFVRKWEFGIFYLILDIWEFAQVLQWSQV